MRKHSKGCVCLACCAARLASPKAPDPLQGSIFEPVRNDLPRSSFRESGAEPSPAGRIYSEGNPAPPGEDWVKDQFVRFPPEERRQLLEGSWEGQERKEEALTAHDQRRRGTLIWLRAQLSRLYILRKAGAQGETYRLKPYVTADDAEMFLRANPDMDPGGPGAWKGSIFRGANWQFTGDLIPSVIAENNGRGQRAWRYVADRLD